MKNTLGLAAIILFVAVTPSWLELLHVWNSPQEVAPASDPHAVRTAILLWFLFVFFVTYSFSHILT